VNIKTPEGWKVEPLCEVTDVIMGQSPASKYYNFEGEGLPFFQGKTEFGEFYPVAKKWCSKPNKIAKNNDILISVRAPVGPTNIANQKCCIGRGLAAVRPLSELPHKYILYFLRSIEQQIESMGTGTTFKAISGQTLRNLPVPLAPPEQQTQIVEEIEKQFSRLDEAVANLKRVKANLKRYKASVLQAAVTGKLTEEWRKQNLPAPVIELGKFYTYAILCEDGSIYIGHTNDIERRWREHREGQGAEWTKEHKPVKIAHYEAFDSREEAAEREKWLKTGFGRKWIKRELAAGRTRQAGDVEPASKLLERILTERRQKWEEAELARLRERHARGQSKTDENWQPKNDKWKEKYKEPVAPDVSDLPELPDGWGLATFEQLGTWFGGGTPSKRNTAYWNNGSVPWVSPKDMKSQLILDSQEKITEKAIKESSAKLIPHGAILFVVRSGILRRILPVGLAKVDVTVNQDIKALAVCSEMKPEFMLYSALARAEEIRHKCQKDGTTVESIEVPALQTFPVAISSREEQQAIIQEIESRLSVAEEIERTVDANLLRAERLRQSILKQAFSGKLV